MSWKSLFGSADLAELPKELTELLAQSKRDSEALRKLLKRSETAAKKFESLVDPIETMQASAEALTAQMSELQARADSFGGVVSTIDEVAEQAARLAESQVAHASFSEEADRTISELTTKVNELRTAVEGAMTAKEESEKLIADVTGPEGSFTEIRAGLDELMVSVSRMEVRSNTFDNSFGEAEERILGVTEQAAELEQVQKVMERSFESVSSRLVETDAKVSELGDAFQSAGLIKREFEDLVGPHGALAKVRAQIEETREQSLVYGQEVARTQEDQAGVRAAQESISSQYKGITFEAGIGRRGCGQSER